MNNEQLYLELLFDKYSNRQATPQEIRELFQLISDGEFDAELIAMLVAKIEDTEISDNYDRELWGTVFARIKDDVSVIDEEVPIIKKKTSYLRMGIAAAIATIVSAAGIWFLQNPEIKIEKEQSSYKSDIPPGAVGATLTLANGKKIKLSDVNNGEIVTQAGITVSKSSNGQLIYEIKSSKGGEQNSNDINTLTTAKGETYILTLPDKSKVWMNSASSLTYSASLLKHGKRRVKLEGEAYFQIAKDKVHPFIVESKGQEIEVLGTHFNVNAYDSAIKTTLLEGSVKVVSYSSGAAANLEHILKPNQQSVLIGGKLTIQDVVAEDAVAWKDGYFMFNSETLEEVMNRISKWYNVTVVYEDNEVRNRTMLGSVSRYENLSKVIFVLERTGVATFKIEDNKIKISK